MRKSLFASGLVAVLVSVGVALPSHAAPPLVAGGSTSCGEGTVSWTPAALWPPNHKPQTVTISYSETDNDGDTLSLSVDQATVTDSDIVGGVEKVGSGSPNNNPDWYQAAPATSGADSGTPAKFYEALRAERSGTDGNGGGRLYTVPVKCTDTTAGAPDAGGGGMATVTVCVPHDMSAASRNFCVNSVP
jgi:hypothetical protein